MTLLRITRTISWRALRAERGPHAHLAGALGDGERHHAVEPGRGQEQRAQPERHEEGAERPCRTRSAGRSPAASCSMS